MLCEDYSFAVFGCVVFHQNLFDAFTVALAEAAGCYCATNGLDFYVSTNKVLVNTDATDEAENQHILIHPNHA